VYFFNTAAGLILAPNEEFARIREDSRSITRILIDFILYLFILQWVIGFSNRFFILSAEAAAFGNLAYITAFNLTSLISIPVNALILNLFAPSFGCERSYEKYFEIESYTAVAALAGAVLNMTGIPYIGLLSYPYKIFLRYKALSIVKECRKGPVFYAILPELITTIIAVSSVLVLFYIYTTHYL